MSRSASKGSTASKISKASATDGRFEDASISLPQFGPGSTQAPQNLIDRLGGEKLVRKVVAEVLRDMRSDPAMGKFFTRVNPTRLKDRICDYLCGEWGGTPYKGPDLWIAHAHMEITNEFYDLFVTYFQSALKRAQTPKSECLDIMASLRQLRHPIVDDRNRVRDFYMQHMGVANGENSKRQASSPRSPSASPRDSARRAMRAADVAKADTGAGAGGSPRSPRTASTRCSTPNSSANNTSNEEPARSTTPRRGARSNSKGRSDKANDFCPDPAFNFSTDKDTPPGQPRGSMLHRDEVSMRLFAKPMLKTSGRFF